MESMTAHADSQDVSLLDDLIRRLYSIFSHSCVDVDLVEALMSSYVSNHSDWKKYAKFDRFKYTRNLVDAGNGKFDIMILCWPENISSAIHDHTNSHCFMKVLQGELQEVRYSWPADEDVQNSGMREISRSRLPLNGVCYINDSLGLHRVENPSHSEPAVSLHLYVPPFSSCRTFDQRTGRSQQCRVTFWSRFGRRIVYQPSMDVTEEVTSGQQDSETKASIAALTRPGSTVNN